MQEIPGAVTAPVEDARTEALCLQVLLPHGSNSVGEKFPGVQLLLQSRCGSRPLPGQRC